ncbi:MAG: hypothetical protein RJA44_2236 [Pseudomonadota bacterium]|jgi:anti-sigma B factor antagonist
MELSSRIEGRNVLVVQCHADRLDASNVVEFKALMQNTTAGAARVVLDLAAVRFVDSSGMGMLVAVLRELGGRRCEMRLCHLAPAVRSLFDLMRMNRVFSIFDSCDVAVQSYT